MQQHTELISGIGLWSKLINFILNTEVLHPLEHWLHDRVLTVFNHDGYVHIFSPRMPTEVAAHRFAVGLVLVTRIGSRVDTNQSPALLHVCDQIIH